MGWERVGVTSTRFPVSIMGVGAKRIGLFMSLISPTHRREEAGLILPTFRWRRENEIKRQE